VNTNSLERLEDMTVQKKETITSGKDSHFKKLEQTIITPQRSSYTEGKGCHHATRKRKKKKLYQKTVILGGRDRAIKIGGRNSIRKN